MTEHGEFALIGRLRARLRDAGAAAAIGIGDDAAVWANHAAFTLATTDTLVAGVHFLPDVSAWADVGWKALAVNLSDIAAMGGRPTIALVTLALPPASEPSDLDALYDGLADCAATHGVRIAGGDVVRASEFSITVALLGEADARSDGTPAVLRRDAARAGDVIAVTGTFGGASAGVRALREGAAGPHASAVSARQMRPLPRLQAGQSAVRAGVRAGIDVSDGLVQDLGHVCAASGVAAEISLEAVPVDADARALYPGDAVACALSGGEDYELLLIGDAADLHVASRDGGVEVSVIGRMLAGAPAVRVLDRSGADVTPAAGGWDHLLG